MTSCIVDLINEVRRIVEGYVAIALCLLRNDLVSLDLFALIYVVLCTFETRKKRIQRLDTTR